MTTDTASLTVRRFGVLGHAGDGAVHPAAAADGTRNGAPEAAGGDDVAWDGAPEAAHGAFDGATVSLYRLRAADGMVATVTDYGATLVSLEVPVGAEGNRDVVLGFEALGGASGHGYRGQQPYLGAVIGRVANRVRGARFTLDGEVHELSANEGGNHIHGGTVGFDKRLWAAQPLRGEEGPELVLNLRSPDGEQGYPGALDARAHYRLRPGALRLELWATCDRATPVSLTNHSYFNLDGQASGSVRDHRLQVFADLYTPLDASLLPTGELAAVAGTPMDFREPRRLDARFDDPALRSARGVGYDANYVVRGEPGRLREAARLTNARGDLSLELWSTQPALQVYSGNYLDGSLVGKEGARYDAHAGIAMEPQSYPDAVNVPHFPNTVLRPGEVYHEVIEYRFVPS